ncbi:ParA family protein [Moraxellaceae bacterium AER2_44_116]|nr:ParA family protein [Moraxellaceae bacterium AER2_44_116]
MAKVILIANQKGGVGKSTIATTLGTGLKRQGYTVLMLDADTQQSLSKWRASAEGLPHEADIPWVERWDSPLIAEKIQKEQAHYDFIIIDSASNLGQKGDATQKIILGAIKSADFVLTPVGPSPFDVDGSEDFIGLLRDIWARFGEQKPPVYFLINGIQPGTTLGREVSEYVANTYQLPVLNTKLQLRQAYRQCVFDGSSIFHVGDSQTKANASAFVDEVLELSGLKSTRKKEAVTK